MAGPAQAQVKNRGWTVTVGATVALLMLGALYAWSVVSQAMGDDPRFANWSEPDLIWPYSIALIAFSVMTAVGGRIQDKRPPKLLIMAGGILAGTGMILCGLSTNPWAWYVGFGLLTGSGIGLAYSAGPPPAVKWFPASKSGLISGIVVAGFGAGAVWVAPTLRALIDSRGIPATMIIFGIAVIVVMVIAAQFVEPPPPGYVPEETATETAAAVPTGADFTPGQMLSTWQFKVMAACFAFGGGAGLIFIGQMASIVTSFGFEVYGALAVSVMALGNGVGRVIYGKASDARGRRPVLIAALAFQAVVLAVMALLPVAGFTLNEYGHRVYEERQSLGLLIVVLILGALIGANYGACLAVFPAMTKDNYGVKNFGANYGLVFQGWGFGGFFVSMVGAFLISAQETAGVANMYMWAYYWAIALLIVGVGLMLAFKAPQAPNS